MLSPLSESRESSLFDIIGQLLAVVILATKEDSSVLEDAGEDDDDDDTKFEEADVAVAVLCRSSRRCSRPTLSRRLAVLSDMMK